MRTFDKTSRARRSTPQRVHLGTRQAPDILNHVIGSVSREKRREGIFGYAGCHLNGIWNDRGSDLLLE